MIGHWLRTWSAAPSTDQIRSSSRSHVGHVRAVNEDRVLDAPDRCLWAVVDGMGGHAGGDRAAAMIVAALAALDRPDAGALETALRGADKAVRSALPGSGATVAVLSIVDDQAHVVWAGDSRVYRRRDHGTTRVTHDHSLVQQLLDAGLIDQVQAADHPQGHVVTQAIGASADFDVGSVSLDVRSGDTFLLCSDGLTRRIDDHAIGNLLEAPPAEATADAIRLALDRDGSDNVSVVVVAVGLSS